MEKLRSLPKLVLDSEEAREVQQQYDHLIVEMDQYEKATVEVCLFGSCRVRVSCMFLVCWHCNSPQTSYTFCAALPQFSGGLFDCRW